VADVEAWKPKTKISRKDPMKQAAECAAETEQNEMPCKAEVDSWIRRKDTMRSNVGQACALLHERCNKVMQAKLQAQKL